MLKHITASNRFNNRTKSHLRTVRLPLGGARIGRGTSCREYRYGMIIGMQEIKSPRNHAIPGAVSSPLCGFISGLDYFAGC